MESIGDMTQEMLRSKGVGCGAWRGLGGNASDGSFAYVCCDSDACNEPTPTTQPVARKHFLPNCSTPEAHSCTNKYMSVYGCHISHIPLQPADECAAYVWGTGSCLVRACNCSCSEGDASSSGADTQGSQQSFSGASGSGSGSAGGPMTEAGAGDAALATTCEKMRCWVPASGVCAPGCRYSEVGDGVCNGLCMNSLCHFDGGDCLSSASWYSGMMQQLGALDTDGDGRVSRAEVEAATAQPWLQLYNAPQLSSNDTFSMCPTAGNAGASLGREQLALLAFAPYFPNALAHHTSSASSSPSGSGSPLGSEAEAQLFGLQPHTQLDALKTGLYIVGAVDADLDGSVSWEEARGGLGLSWHEFAYMNRLQPSVAALEPDEIAALLLAVVDTLGGRPWPAAEEAWYGADVSASVTVKLLARCKGGEVSEVAARALGITTEGFRWADADGSETLGVDEVLATLKTGGVGARGLSAAAVQVDTREGVMSARLGMPGLRPAETRWLVLPEWHYELPMAQEMLADYAAELPSTVAAEEASVCTHSDARLEQIRRFLFHRKRLTGRRASASSATVSGAATRSGLGGGKGGTGRAGGGGSWHVSGSEEASSGIVGPRLEAMLRATRHHTTNTRAAPHSHMHTASPAAGGRRMLQDGTGSSSAGSGGGEGEEASSSRGRAERVEPLEFPFTVSLERPACGVLGMLADAVEEGAFKLYQREQEVQEARARRQAALGTSTSTSNTKAGSGTGDGSGEVFACGRVPLEFMVADVVMAGLDSDGDGGVSLEETCLSEAELFMAAHRCRDKADPASPAFDPVALLQCRRGLAASSYDFAASPHSNISRAQVHALVLAYLFEAADGDSDGVVGVGAGAAASSALLDTWFT